MKRFRLHTRGLHGSVKVARDHAWRRAFAGSVISALLLVALLNYGFRQHVPSWMKPRSTETSPSLPSPRMAMAVPPSQDSSLPKSAGALSLSRGDTQSALNRFQDWTGRFLAASPAERIPLEEEGARLASERRSELRSLISRDPREALRQAVPMVARQQLPARIVELLEERINARGVLRSYYSTPTAGVEDQPSVLRYAEFANGATFHAHIYGRRTESTRWTPNASINGIAVDDQLAVNESPLRPLELGEIPSPEKLAVQVCPVSGQTTVAVADGQPVTEENPAVEAYGRIIYLCDGSHTVIYERQLIQGEGASGGPRSFTGILPAAPSPSLGQLRVLYIPMTFADQNQIPATEAKCYEVMATVADFFSKASFGRLACLPTVTPPIKLPHDEAWYKQKDQSDGVTKEIDGLGLEHQHAREEARKLGYDSAAFDSVVVRLSGGPRTAGGWGGGNSVWIYGDSPSTVAHELGHTFGLSHANFWDTAGASAIGPGANQEYGNPFDVMGGGPFPKNHYNTQAKNQIKWLPDDFVQTVTESGLYRVYAFDQTVLDPTRRYALKITKDAQRTYWGEVRALFDNDNKWIANGLLLGWKWPGNSGGNIQLIDATPGSPGAKNDAPIVAGATFTDAEAGINITTLSVNTGPDGERSADIIVNLGYFSSNQPPTLSLNASALNVPVNTPVTFTAQASDPDGDTLAYHWLSSDNTAASTAIIGSNAPAFTRNFPSNGKYVVTCRVSDMKGGAAIQYKTVTVGTGGSQFAISGRVTIEGAGLAGVYVATGGNNAVLTASDGSYSIPGLAAGTSTVSAQLYGYSFVEMFNNSIVLGPNFNGADFSADPVPALSISASIPTAFEAGRLPGKFTLTRTGPDADPLSVKILSLAGRQTVTNYTLSPTLTAGSPFSTVTIPAGQSTLDISVLPIDDSLPEPPERVVLQIASDPAYVISGPAMAAVTIEDNDSPLPSVAISAPAIPALENPVRSSRFTITRSGPVSSNLTVLLKYAGTAAPGTDYTTLPAFVTIPAGAAFTTLAVDPVDDPKSEGFESVIAALAPSPSYLLNPAATNATVWITDDDLQIVTLASPPDPADEVDPADPNASSDPAIFIATRSGDISGPLTVYYSLSGSALHGVDYEPLPGSVTFLAGQERAAIAVTPRFDRVGDNSETVTIQLASGGSNYKLGAKNSGTATLVDNVDPPYVGVIALTSVREPSTAGKFRFTRQGNKSMSVTVRYTVSGTAAPGADYSALSGSVILGASANSVDVTVASIDDGVLEDLESITVTIAPSSDYGTWDGTRSATLWLFDDEGPTVFVDAHTTSSTGTATLQETSSARGKFYLSRTGSTNNSLIVNYLMSGTASNGADYQALPGVATIAAGAPGVDVTVAIMADSVFEGTEAITLSLAPGKYSRGPGATIYLLDNQTSTRSVGFTNRASVALESAGTVRVPVYLSRASAGTVTVQYGIASSGASSSSLAALNVAAPGWLRLTRTGGVFRSYYSTNGVIWNQIGSTMTMTMADPVWVGLAVCSRSDGTLATATFENPVLAPAQGGTWIGRNVGFVSAAGALVSTGNNYAVSGSGGDIGGNLDEFYFAAQLVVGNFSFTSRLASSSGGNTNRLAGLMVREDMRANARHIFVAEVGTAQAQVIYRENSAITALGAGVDYQVTPGLLTFPPGTTSNSIPVTIVEDSRPEGNEQIVITLASANGAALGTNQHVVVIRDDDAPLEPSIGFATASSVVAENGFPSVVVALSTPSEEVVSVAYAVSGGTATASADYDLPDGQLVFSPGETAKVLPMVLINDDLIEEDETVRIQLSDPSGALLSTHRDQLLTILDDDRPVVTVRVVQPNATESGDPGEWTLTRSGSLADLLLVAISVRGTAQSGADFVPLGSAVIVPAGQQSVSVPLVPLPNIPVEGDETVVLTVEPGSGYAVGSPAAGAVTISDRIVPTVTVAASRPEASETGRSPGMFTIRRSTPGLTALRVNYTVTGTATSGTDYASIGASAVIPAGETSVDIAVTPVDDTITEGPEFVVMALSQGANYLTGSASHASVTITDNDSPPSLFISSPAAKAVHLAPGLGLNLEAAATDDGAPEPLRYAWEKFSGPGVVTFDSPGSAATGATFSTNGLYVVRIRVTDWQFTVKDDVTVQVGPFVPSDWVDASIGSPATRGLSGPDGEGWVVEGAGTGFSGTADSGHFVCRQAAGTSSVAARITEWSGTTGTAIAGVMMRESSYRGSRRVLLGVRTNGTVQLRTRATRDAADSSTGGGAVALPVWLKLERAGDEIIASKASDADAARNSWTPIGNPVTLAALSETLSVGLGVSNGTGNPAARAFFSQVSVAPAPEGPAIVAEDLGAPSLAGSNSLNGSTHTLNASGSLGDAGRFRFQQYVGDVTVTARILNHTASAMTAKGGVMIRDISLDSSAHGMMGIAHYWGGYFVWRNVSGGSRGTSYGGSKTNPQWIRLVRTGGALTAWKAPNSSNGQPGAWAQQGAFEVFSADAPVYVGLAADSGSSSVLNTVQLDRLSIEPGNLAPVVSAGPAITGIAGEGVVPTATASDDGKPASPGAITLLWTKVSGPGWVHFSDASSVNPAITASLAGTYRLRLTADDGQASVYSELTCAVSPNPLKSFPAWQASHFPGGSANPDAAENADPDGDGWVNLIEYAFGTDPLKVDSSQATILNASIAGSTIRITVPKNPAAADILYEIEFTLALGESIVWKDAGLVVEQDTGNTLVFRDPVPAPARAAMYYRLKLSRMK